MTRADWRSIMHRTINHPSYKSLGYTDRQCIEYLAFGMTLGDVADEFRCTRQAVQQRRSRILRKIGIYDWCV